MKLWSRWGRSPEKAKRASERAEHRLQLDEAAKALRGGGDGVPEVIVDEPDVDERRTILSPAPAVVPVVEVTERRTAGTAQEKSGDVLSPRFLAWVRSMPCAFCAAKAPSDPHHFPTKGSLGMTVDMLALPACRSCHDKAHDGRIGKVQQCVALIGTLVHFFTRTPRSLKREVFTEIAKGLG